MVEIQKLFLLAGSPHSWKLLVASEFVGKTVDIEFVTLERKNDYFLNIAHLGI